MERAYRWRWRTYRTASGADPIREFLSERTPDERRAILAAMEEVRQEGLRAARHLRGDIYEVRVMTARSSLRVLFAQEARPVMLALVAYQKTTQKAPSKIVELAERRLRDWRSRGGRRA
jgi:phage-related protein